MNNKRIRKLLEFTLRLIRKARIPLFSCKFSRKDFTQHQHLALLVLKHYMVADYRKACQVAEELKSCSEVLKLARIPHFTTLQKFFGRMKGAWLDRLFSQIFERFRIIKYLALDSTGMLAGHCSHYFVRRIDRKLQVSNFPKLSVMLDVKRRLPATAVCHVLPRHDSRDFQPLMKKVRQKADYFVADKAYECKMIVEVLKGMSITPIIPLKLGKNPVKATWRKRLLRKWVSHPHIQRQYNQRSLIESFFSALKRRLGEGVASRHWQLQRREAVLKVLIYSIMQRSEVLFLIGFLQSLVRE